MGNIRVLDKNTINKIAAGEVIERPASVVKELVENSIDAGATIITCEIKDGGKSFIRITDNGSGFLKDDIKVAFLRHATSKIKDENDLDHIKSLGFRGEALSSISSIAKIELLTKRKDDFLGNRIELEGGSEISFSEAGCPDGTTFIIKDLFFNTPARKKFLKSNVTEAGYISDLINRLAISHPDISFRFINQGKTIFYTNGNSNEKDALYSIFGRDVANNLIKVSYESDDLIISGYIGKPAILRGNRVNENYYINGRFSKAKIITGAIEEAYKGYAMQHKYPFTSLHFEFPLEKLDVNVHPTKMEIRIADGDYYYNIIYSAIKKALENSNMIVSASVDNTRTIESIKRVEIAEKVNKITSIPEQFETNRLREETRFNIPVENSKLVNKQIESATKSLVETFESKAFDSKIKENKIIESKPLEDKSFETKETNSNIVLNKTLPKEDFKQLSFADTKNEFVKSFEADNFNIVGQVFDTYWIVQKDDNMFMIDQHAAHEKVLYERTIKRYKTMQAASQQLFPPIIVTLSIIEEETLKKHMDSFLKLGFEIESFGGRDYSITAVPTDLFRFTGEEFFHDLLDNLINSPVKGDMEIVCDRIASMSCKAAIKGNMSISTIEAHTLIKELLALDNPYHCPHGRPVIICLTKNEIEKKFKRIL